MNIIEIRIHFEFEPKYGLCALIVKPLITQLIAAMCSYYVYTEIVYRNSEIKHILVCNIAN